MDYEQPNFYQEYSIKEEAESVISSVYNIQEPKLILYVIRGCPFCKKVLAYLHQADTKVLLKDVRQDKEALKELLEIGEKKQVPCLSIDGKALYESDDIIAWFKAHS